MSNHWMCPFCFNTSPLSVYVFNNHQCPKCYARMNSALYMEIVKDVTDKLINALENSSSKESKKGRKGNASK